MPDLSASFNPAHVSAASDAASSAMLLASDAESKAALYTSGTDSPSFNNLQIKAHVYFDAEVDNGNSGSEDTIVWPAGNKQKSTLTADCTYTFTAPTGPCNLILKIIQDVTGGWTVTWPNTVKWPSGTAPTLSTGAGDIDIICFYFDGTNYYGSASIDFSVPT